MFNDIKDLQIAEHGLWKIEMSEKEKQGDRRLAVETLAILMYDHAPARDDMPLPPWALLSPSDKGAWRHRAWNVWHGMDGWADK